MTLGAWLRRVFHVVEHTDDLARSERERALLRRRAGERQRRLESLGVEGRLMLVPKQRPPER